MIKKVYWNTVYAYRKTLSRISPSRATKYYTKNTGKTLNLKNPVEFKEKLQWLKLNTYLDIGGRRMTMGELPKLPN